MFGSAKKSRWFFVFLDVLLFFGFCWFFLCFVFSPKTILFLQLLLLFLCFCFLPAKRKLFAGKENTHTKKKQQGTPKKQLFLPEPNDLFGKIRFWFLWFLLQSQNDENPKKLKEKNVFGENTKKQGKPANQNKDIKLQGKQKEIG